MKGKILKGEVQGNRSQGRVQEMSRKGNRSPGNRKAEVEKYKGCRQVKSESR